MDTRQLIGARVVATMQLADGQDGLVLQDDEGNLFQTVRFTGERFPRPELVQLHEVTDREAEVAVEVAIAVQQVARRQLATPAPAAQPIPGRVTDPPLQHPATCEVCGKALEPKPGNTNRWCSRKCSCTASGRLLRVNAVPKPAPRPCEVCGKEFTPAYGRTGRWCSHACAMRSRKLAKAASSGSAPSVEAPKPEPPIACHPEAATTCHPEAAAEGSPPPQSGPGRSFAPLRMTGGELADRHQHLMHLDNKRRGVCQGCSTLQIYPDQCSNCVAKNKCAGCGTIRDYAQEEDAAGQYGRQSYRKPAGATV